MASNNFQEGWSINYSEMDQYKMVIGYSQALNLQCFVH